MSKSNYRNLAVILLLMGLVGGGCRSPGQEEQSSISQSQSALTVTDSEACEDFMLYDGNTYLNATFEPHGWPEPVELKTNWGPLGAGFSIPYLRVSGQKSTASDWVSGYALKDVFNLENASIAFSVRSSAAVKLGIRLRDTGGNYSGYQTVNLAAGTARDIVINAAALPAGSADLTKISHVHFDLIAVPQHYYVNFFLDNIRLDCATVSSGGSSSTPKPSLDELIVEMKDLDGDPRSNWMRIAVRIENPGASTIDLKDVVVQYQFKDSGTDLIQVGSDSVFYFNTHNSDWSYSEGSPSDVLLNVVKANELPGYANDLLFIRFDNGVLPPGGVAEIQIGMHKSDWSRFDETDDLSYRNTTGFTKDLDIGLYLQDLNQIIDRFVEEWGGNRVRFWFQLLSAENVSVRYKLNDGTEYVRAMTQTGNSWSAEPNEAGFGAVQVDDIVSYKFEYRFDGENLETPWYDYIYVGSDIYIPTSGIDAPVKPYDPSTPITVQPDQNSRYSYAVFTQRLTQAERESIQNDGVNASGNPIPAIDIVRIVHASPDLVILLLGHQANINDVADYLSSAVPSFFGIAPLLKKKFVDRAQYPTTLPGEPLRIRVACYANVEDEDCLAWVDALSVGIVDSSSDVVEALVEESTLENLSDLEGVEAIFEVTYDAPTLFQSRNAIKVDALQSFAVYPTTTGTSHTGEWVDIGIYDSGVDSTHPAFLDDSGNLRMVAGMNADNWAEPLLWNNHGTHVAGIAAGNGKATTGDAYSWRGIAVRANLWSGYNTTAPVDEVGHVVNHSHAIDDSVGYYHTHASQIDKYLHQQYYKDNRNKTVVYSAGNEGEKKQNGNQIGYYSTKGPKNPIVVGSTWFDISESTSLGPTRDGRIKPDVMTQGQNVFSTIPPVTLSDGTIADYMEMSGTSMAAPHVTGTVALMLQAFKDNLSECSPLSDCAALDEKAPVNATNKAVLIHTAEDLIRARSDVYDSTRQRNPDLSKAVGADYNTFYEKGPDWATGWGMVDAEKAVHCVENDLFKEIKSLRQGQQVIVNFDVTSVRPEIRFTLAWDDVEAASNSYHNGTPKLSWWQKGLNLLPFVQIEAKEIDRSNVKRLVNDMDVYLESPSGTIYYPWRIDPPIDPSKAFPLPGDGLDSITPDMIDDGQAYNNCTASDPLDESCFDHRNNVERVDVANPELGLWKAVIIGRDIDDAQDFSIVSDFTPILAYESTNVIYRAHVKKKAWLAWQANGAVAGTTGQKRRMEAVEIKLENAPSGMGIEYRAHVKSKGWLPWVSDGATAGTTGESRQMEAVEIRLVNPPPGYSLTYQAHVAGKGWLPWVIEGQTAGTTGENRRMEAVRIVLNVPPPHVRYVDESASVGGNGYTPATAFKYLQDALYAASLNSDINEIRIAEGTYQPDDAESAPVTNNDRSASFELSENLVLKGGFPQGFRGARDPEYYPTILNGLIEQSPSTIYSLNVVSFSGPGTASLDGLTVENGSADMMYPMTYRENRGGGLYCIGGAMRIENVKFRENRGRYAGGAVYSENCPLTLSNSRFELNESEYGWGGAVFVSSDGLSIENTTFSENRAEVGGALYLSGGYYNTMDILESTFTLNHADGDGGAIYAEYLPLLNLKSCAFEENTAGDSGGAVRSDTNDIRIVNTTFYKNEAQSDGGALYSSDISMNAINSLFIYNEAVGGSGGGAQVGAAVLTNCLFSENTAALTGGGLINTFGFSATVVNTSFWNDTATTDPEINGNSTVTYSIVEGGRPGTGNLSMAPGFTNSADPKGGDGIWGTIDDGFLCIGMCVDAADPATNMGMFPTDTGGNRIDFKKQPRLRSTAVDIGPYELPLS